MPRFAPIWTECDRCGALAYSSQRQRPGAFVRLLRRDGWSVEASGVICPDCRDPARLPQGGNSKSSRR